MNENDQNNQLKLDLLTHFKIVFYESEKISKDFLIIPNHCYGETIFSFVSLGALQNFLRRFSKNVLLRYFFIKLQKNLLTPSPFTLLTCPK